MAYLMQRALLAGFFFMMWEHGFAEESAHFEEAGTYDVEEEGEEEGQDGDEMPDDLDEFGDFDHNRDGKVSFDELMETVRHQFSQSETMSREEGSGESSETPFADTFLTERTPAMFTAVDDGDGFLSESELQLFLQALDDAYEEWSEIHDKPDL
eukprot:TRINITY_DN10198_c0_g1_i1.p1 TRINITY_DN10198_c0_g1~~TRINITY_DN10198_c0_g1_i1.p1  ORF type:complete len:169 (-),score=42.69 TRINITY_DN10198_c0_g1_i1:21-482(-)